jgi:AhpD family alkylhydroperoxidase
MKGNAMTRILKTLIASTAVSAAILLGPIAAQAEDMNSDAVYADIEKTFGGVPSFVKQLPKSSLAALWEEEKAVELSDKTALPPKTKALISLAVASQIPCTYCIWADTMTAKQLGASDEEIAEAVTMAGHTRLWSTMFNGLQVDFEQFKKEMGGQ